MTSMNNIRITLHQTIFFHVLASKKISNASLHPMTPSDTCDFTDLRQPPKTEPFSKIYLAGLPYFMMQTAHSLSISDLPE